MVTVLRTPVRPEVHSLVDTWSYLMKNIVARFLKDESGATAIEYGLIATGIALAVITTLNLVGTNLSAKFQLIADKLG
jgi:pilus assembly protein Flp/PilA